MPPHANSAAGVSLLKILDQFSHSFDCTLDFYDMRGNLRVGGFAADRIGLAKHLLQDEIEFPSSGFSLLRIRTIKDFAEHLQMTGEPGNLFADVDSIGIKLNFAKQVDRLHLLIMLLEHAFNL